MNALNRIPVAVKLPAIMVALSLFALGITTTLSYVLARGSLADQAATALEQRAATQATQIEDYMAAVQVSLAIQVANPFVHEALDRFREGWDQVPGDAPSLLAEAYIARNPNGESDRAAFDGANDGSQYTRYHRIYHPYFRATRDAHGLGDIYLVDTRGNVVYSVSKTGNFAQSAEQMTQGSGLLAAVGATRKTSGEAEPSFVDFAADPALGTAQSAYLADAVFDKSDRFLGHVVYRLTTAPLMQVVQSNASIVAEVLLRADGSVLAGTDLNEATQINADLVSQTRSASGVFETKGVSGADAFVGFANIEVLGASWTLLSEKDRAVQLAAATGLLHRILLSVLALLAVICGLGIVLARSVSRPLVQVGSAIRDIAQGRLDIAFPALDRGDEIGTIANSLKTLTDDLAKAALTEAENRFKSAAFNSSSAALMIVDADFAITFVNPQAVDLMRLHRDAFSTVIPNFDPESVVGSSVARFHQAQSQAEDKMHSMDSGSINAEIEMGPARFALRVAAVLDPDGTKLGYVAEWQDVTQERQQAAVLQAIDTRQCMFEISPAGDVMACNENTRRALAISSDSTLTFWDLWAKSDADKASALWKTLSEGQGFNGKVALQNALGAPVWLQVAVTPVLSRSGTPQKFMCVASDITEAEQALIEASLAQTKMTESQNLVVKEVSAGLERLSAGDLMSSIDVIFDPQYEQLRNDFNAALAHLATAMSGVTENADAIRGEAHEISTAADDLSKRTEQQAATLEQTAAALDQLTASVRSAAEGAERANIVVADARGNAVESGEVVKEAVSAMGQIEQSSRQISKIIGVIDDIAFQTNLLALNAGVEAARAGEAGRGFAVVASEVRALAQRSSEAAKEIGALISSSGAQVKRGVGLVDDAGKALERIVNSVTNIADHVSEIAVSAQQQSCGLAEINIAVNQLDSVTQQNAAMFEETTAASHALTREAQNLTDMIARFKTKPANAKPAVPKVADHPRETQRAAEKPSKNRNAVVQAQVNGSTFALVEENEWDEF